MKSHEFDKISKEQLNELKIYKIAQLKSKVRFTSKPVVALNNRLQEIEEEIVIRAQALVFDIIQSIKSNISSIFQAQNLIAELDLI